MEPVEAEPEEAPEPVVVSHGKPTYKKWWPWTILGVALAGGAGVGVWLGLTYIPRAPSADTTDGTLMPFGH